MTTNLQFSTLGIDQPLHLHTNFTCYQNSLPNPLFSSITGRYSVSSIFTNSKHLQCFSQLINRQNFSKDVSRIVSRWYLQYFDHSLLDPISDEMVLRRHMLCPFMEYSILGQSNGALRITVDLYRVLSKTQLFCKTLKPNPFSCSFR